MPRRSALALVAVLTNVGTRALTVLLLLTVVVIALLGLSTPVATAHAESCEHGACLPSDLADATGHDSAVHDFPAHDPCLHDYACGGGAALSLAGLLLGVVPAATVLHPRQPVAVTSVPAMPTGGTATLVGGIERPPRVPR